MTSSRWMLVKHAQGRETRYELDEPVTVIGRATDCKVVVAEGAVSRRHAEIRRETGRYLLRDLDSRNGTLLNGSPVTVITELHPGDRIAVAAVEFSVIDGSAPVGTPDTARLNVSDTVLSTGVEVPWDEIQELRVGRFDRRDRLFQVLVEAGDMLTAASHPAELYGPVLDLIDTAFTPKRTALLLLDESGVPRVTSCRESGHGTRGENLVLSRTVIRRVLEERVSLLIEDFGLDDSPQLMQSIVAQGIRAGMAVPLVDDDRVVGILYADTTAASVRYERDDLKAFTLLAGVVGNAFAHARYHALETDRRRLEAELEAARGILAEILPARLPEVAGLELWAHLESCQEVGGDLYDLQVLSDGRLLVVGGDVVGKGLGAALLVSSIVPVLRLLVETDRDPAVLVERLNRHVWRTTDTSRFATLFVGLLEPRTGRLDYVNAGHNPLYRVSPAGELSTLGSTGPPVGMLEGIDFAAARVDLAPGELLVLYSDGISEAESPTADVFYGEGRFEQRLRELAGQPPRQVADGLLEDLHVFLAGRRPDDDLTLVLVRRC
ncbi:MAG: SpoIIE family protein phosphatase [Candidatus Krumholzibacteriia bacterium]